MQQRFYGLSLTDVRQLAFQLAERNNIDVPFSKVTQLAGKDWMSGFLRIHKTISLRTPEATSLSRATGFNRVQVGKFYNLLKSVLETESDVCWNLRQPRVIKQRFRRERGKPAIEFLKRKPQQPPKNNQ
jgi:hypothetical protein